jgi:nitrite reductase/ring-hydroxylating ferredoxin subunit
VVVQGLEADDPNTTLGSTMRVWSSGDLVTWTPIEGETATTLLDGQASAIRSFDDRIVVTGTFNGRADQADPEATASMLPAIWVSTDGDPFVRTLLGSSDASTSPSAAVMDLVSTGSGYVAVGGAGDPSAPLAWTSPDLVDWSTVTITSANPPSGVEDATSRLLWDVEMLPDGTLLVAGTGFLGAGSFAEGWLSEDGGADWRTVGVGPGSMTLWNGGAVGMSGDNTQEPTFWTWGGDTQPRSSSIDLGAAEDLEVGEVRWHADRQLYLARTDTAVMAFAQQSPKQGCRLALADDNNTFDEQLTDGAAFSDPCHGATFALDGTHLSGPSPRDLDRYRVEIRAGRIIVDTTDLLAAP